jgi:dTDP-L-rhamnose 4-epimerase
VTQRRVVVTGGAGFIGSAVVSTLAGGGDDVVVLDSMRPDVHRDGGSAASRRLDAVELVLGDVRDTEMVDRVLKGADAVVHLAAKVGLGVDVDDMDDYVSSNDLGTAVLLRVASRTGVPRLVQASSMVVYGEGRYTCAEHGVVPPAARTAEALQRLEFEPPCPVCGGALSPGLVGEDAPLDPRNTYAATKVAQEHLASSWARETGSSAVSLRLHNVYGAGLPRDTPYAGVAARFVSSLDRGEPPRVYEDGRQRRDFVHVDDVARAFAAALDAADDAGHHAYNVGSGTVTTIGGMARALADARGGPDPVVTGEYRLGDVRHITASSHLASDRLGWSARVSLTEGVRDLVGV